METLEGFDAPAPIAAVILSVLLVLGFASYVIYKTMKTGVSSSLEDFLTAKNSIPVVTVGLSLYASAVGSGALTGPAEFGFFLGAMGVFAYAFATAVPLLFIGWFSPLIQDQYPQLYSLSDFIKFRFGPITQTFVVLLTLLNMSAASIAEYTTLASLYSDFVGLGDFGFLYILLISATTLGYTGYAGLRASIVTDRLQAIFGLFLIQVLIIYATAALSEEELKEEANVTSLPFTSELKGLNEDGYGSLFTLTLSLISATIFSEAMWQRGWASNGRKALRIGSVIGFCLVFILVATTGSMGLIVRWGNIVTFDDLDTFNPNLYLFQIFPNERGASLVDSPIGILVLLLATTLSMGALDSLQNGIEASISGAINSWFTDATNLKVARSLLILINVPLMIIGLQKYSILSVFLVSNMFTVSAMLPLALGFFDFPPLTRLHRDWIPVTQFSVTILIAAIWSSVEYDGLGNGLKFIFWENTLFLWRPFLVVALGSISSTILIYLSLFLFSLREQYRETSIVSVVVRATEVEEVEVKDPEIKAEKVSV